MTSRMEKLLPYFPDFNSGDIQNIVLHMNEFAEMSGGPDIKDGDFFKSQIFAARLALMNNRLLLVYAPGVGKSCVQISAMMTIYSVSDFYEFTIISTITSLTENMEYQALCKCTKGLLTNGKKNEVFKKKMKIMNHLKTIRLIVGKTSSELNTYFSNKILMIDEISKIILSDSSSAKHNGNETSYSVDSTFKNINRLIALYKKGKKTLQEIIDDESIIDLENKYVQFWRLSHSCKTLKFIGLTGTPITNHPLELFLLLNLFLDINEQYNIEKISTDIFHNIMKRLMRAKSIISYLEPSSSTATALYRGNLLKYTHEIKGLEKRDSSLRLTFTEMYHIQAETMLNLGIVLTAQNNIYQIQSFVNKEGIYGKNSYEEKEERKESDDESEDEELDDETDLSDPLTRMQCASLFTQIISFERKLFDASQDLKPKNLKKIKTKTYEGAGCSFIYNKMTTTVNKPLKKIAEKYGFRVIMAKDLDVEKTSSDKLCGSDSIVVTGLSLNNEKPTIIFIDGKMKDKKAREKIIQVISSKENVRGLKVQAVVTSRVTEMGYSFGNMERIYMLCSQWSPATDKQVLFRVLRADGHNHLREWMKEHNRPYISTVETKYFTPYCKFFYIKTDDYDKIETQDFFVDEEIEENKSYMRLSSKHLAYIVCFSEPGIFDKLKINGIRVLGSELFNFCTDDECPYDFFERELLKNEMENVLSKKVDFENKDLIYCYCGILYLCRSENINDLLSNYALVYKLDTFNFKKIETPYDSSSNDKKLKKLSYVIILKGNQGNITQNHTRVFVLSQAYNQYMTMERKNIIAKKFIRPLKQISIDCLAYKDRNTFDSKYDYTDVCDFEKCEFECSSELFPVEHTEDSFIKEQDMFYDNKETIFSGDEMKKCKSEILGKLQSNKKEYISDIYQSLLPRYRDKIITKTIISILGVKMKDPDNFGFQNFVCANDDFLFLRRDLNEERTNYLHFSDLDTLVGIDTKQDFNLESINVDEESFIELMKMVPKNGKTFNESEQARIITTVKSFVLSSSQSKYLEQCCLDIIKYKSTGKNNGFKEKISSIILGAFRMCILKFTEDGQDYYINTLPRTTMARSQKNTDGKTINPDNFRILKEPYTNWVDASAKDVKQFKPKIIAEIKSMLDPKLTLKVLSPFYISVNDKGEYILVLRKEKELKLEPLIPSDNIIKTITKSVKYIEKNAFLDYYIKATKEKIEDSKEKYSKKLHNVKKVIEKFHSEEENEEKLELFIRICKLFDLFCESDFTLEGENVINFEDNFLTFEILSKFSIIHKNDGKNSFYRETISNNGLIWSKRDLATVDTEILNDMYNKLEDIRGKVYLDYYVEKEKSKCISRGKKFSKDKNVKKLINLYLDSEDMSTKDKKELFLEISILLDLRYVMSYEISSGK